MSNSVNAAIMAARLDVNDILRRRRLNFQIDEIRFSLGMVQRPPDERGGILPQFFLR